MATNPSSRKPGVLRTMPFRQSSRGYIEVQTEKGRDKAFESKEYGSPKNVFSRFIMVYNHVNENGGDFFEEFNSQTSYHQLLDSEKSEALIDGGFTYRYVFYVNAKTISFYYNHESIFPLAIHDLHKPERDDLMLIIKQLYSLGFEVNDVTADSFQLKYLLRII